MDLALLERLVPHIAWPIVALVALPFVYFRLGAVNRLYSLISSNKFQDLIDKVDQLEQKLGSLKDQMAALEQSALWERIDKLPSSYKSIQGSGETATVLYEKLNSKWSELEDIVAAKMEQFGGQYDRRSINGALQVLTDASRRVPLASQDAHLIAQLHSLLRSFRRLKESAGEWLTPEVYTSFVSSVEDVKPKIKGVQ